MTFYVHWLSTRAQPYKTHRYLGIIHSHDPTKTGLHPWWLQMDVHRLWTQTHHAARCKWHSASVSQHKRKPNTGLCKNTLCLSTVYMDGRRDQERLMTTCPERPQGGTSYWQGGAQKLGWNNSQESLEESSSVATWAPRTNPVWLIWGRDVAEAISDQVWIEMEDLHRKDRDKSFVHTISCLSLNIMSQFQISGNIGT